MSDAQRAVMAFAIIALVLILTPRYLRWLSPPPEGPFPAEEERLPRSDSLPALRIPAARPPPRPAATSPARDLARPAPTEQWEEHTVTVETHLYRATISSRGGGSITFFELKDYPHGSGQGLAQLVPAGGDVNLRLAYVNLDGDSVRLTQNFEVLSAPGKKTVFLDDGSLTLSYRHTFPSGSQVRKRLTLYADRYTMPLKVDWVRPGDELGIGTFEIVWPKGLQTTEKKILEDETYGEVYVYQGDKPEKSKRFLRGQRTGRYGFPGMTSWVAVRNKYFTAAFIAQSDQPGVYGAFHVAKPPRGNARSSPAALTSYDMAIYYNAREAVETTLYLGPLSYFLINDLGVDLQKIMSLSGSIIRPISIAVLYSLVFLHDYIPNYGVVLILFAIFVRIITNPLTKKSALSTQKMQLIQPRVKVLQDKYKGNPKKLNQEMMALWKVEGVNPFGGCLPILIQMPVLIALFTVFRSTIELRGQPFLLWITDLSAPDVVLTLPFSIPLYGSGVTILALVMGITMFVQQKMSGASANPQQKPMMYVMTGFFFLIFNQFPSGLNLYYAFSNILGIFQQRNIRNQLLASQASQPDAAPVVKAGKPRKSGKRR